MAPDPKDPSDTSDSSPLAGGGTASTMDRTTPVKKRKLTRGRIVALVIAIVLAAPVLGIAGLLGLSELLYKFQTRDQGVDTTQTQVAPTQSGAFLDDRYVTGARELVIPAYSVEPKGFTGDREDLAVWVNPDGDSWIYSENELHLYDVASAELVQQVTGVAACSGITDTDTVYCTQHTFGQTGEGTGMVERSLREIDVVTGETLNVLQLPAIGTLAVRYLGESDDYVFLELNSSDGLGTPTESTLHAVSLASGEFAWTYLIGGEEWNKASDGCVLVEARTRVACKVLNFLDGEERVPTSVLAVDTATGELASDVRSERHPVLGSDGWIDPYDSLQGVSIEGSRSGHHTVYSYAGTDISGRFDDQLDELIGHLKLVPVPNPIGSEPFVTYPLDSYLQDSIGTTLVMDAQGMPVMTNKNSSSAEGIEMERVSDGELLFRGVPLAVTADGRAVLYTADRSVDTGTLIDVETGKTIYEIEDGAELVSRYYLKFGVISYAMDYEGGETLLLPGG